MDRGGHVYVLRQAISLLRFNNCVESLSRNGGIRNNRRNVETDRQPYLFRFSRIEKLAEIQRTVSVPPGCEELPGGEHGDGVPAPGVLH